MGKALRCFGSAACSNGCCLILAPQLREQESGAMFCEDVPEGFSAKIVWLPLCKTVWQNRRQQSEIMSVTMALISLSAGLSASGSSLEATFGASFDCFSTQISSPTYSEHIIMLLDYKAMRKILFITMKGDDQKQNSCFTLAARGKQIGHIC